MKKTQIKTTQAQRDAVLELLAQDRWKEAVGYATALGFEGITAEFFEYVIAKDGFHNGVIYAIATYYDNDLHLAKHISEVRE